MTRLAIASSLCLVFVATLLSTTSAAGDRLPVPIDGVYLGAFVGLDATWTDLDRRVAMTEFESMTGRRAILDRQYYGWDVAWPTVDDEWSRDQGRVPYISWGTRKANKVRVPWSEIAAGVHDATIDARATALAAFGSPVVFSFNHEPEDDNNGTAADFIAAYRRVHDRFVAAGATNVTFAWTMMAWSFRVGGSAPSFYPGDDVVDVIAADGYNWYACADPPGPWRSFKDIFARWHTFGAGRGKPMMIAEWGSNEDSAQPGRKAQWITAAATQLRSWPDVEAALYFHNDGGCPRWLNSSQSSLDAYRAMAADPYFAAGLAGWSPPAPTTTPPVTTSSPPPITSSTPPPTTMTTSTTTTTTAPTTTAAEPTTTTPPTTAEPTTTLPPTTMSPPPPSPGDVLLSEDFETGLGKWSPATGVSIASDDPIGGVATARALGTASTAGFARAGIGGSHPSVSSTVWFKLVSRGPSKVVVLRLLSESSAWLVGVFVQPNGALGLRNDVAGVEKVSTDPLAKVTLGRWHQLRLELSVVTGRATVFLDGHEASDIGFIGSFGTGTIGRVQIGDSTKRTFDLRFDDLSVLAAS